jgi:RimJ/RimL family protein N-acetyltransferase/8-oxo-dGTP pyrophosphatase MutT (NUDIX family)
VSEPAGSEEPLPPQPTLTDGEVILRPWTLDDVDEARLQHDQEMTRWFGFENVIPSVDQQRAAIERWAASYLDNRQRVSFLVEVGGKVAGMVEVRQKGDGVGELSWAVFPDHRRQHIATRAVRLLVDYCFAELGLFRVDARVEPGNIASLRTAGRAGLRREGVMRQSETTGGVRRDYVLLARLVDDPPPHQREGFTGVLNAGLPTKRVIAQGLIRSTTGKVLLCQLTYKREWDLPGGVVDRHESPAHGLSREIVEELGVELPNHGLILVNWLPPWRGWDDACQFVFDLGVHDEASLAGMVLEPREIAALHWCTLAEALEHVPPYQAAILPRLLGGPGAVPDEAAGTARYLEAGADPT